MNGDESLSYVSIFSYTMTTDNRSTLFFLSSENEVDVFKDFVKSMDDSTKKMIEIGENNWDKVSRGMFGFVCFLIITLLEFHIGLVHTAEESGCPKVHFFSLLCFAIVVVFVKTCPYCFFIFLLCRS